MSSARPGKQAVCSRQAVFVVSDWLKTLRKAVFGVIVSDDILRSPYFNLSYGEFRTFLGGPGELLLDFEDPWHGRIEVYAIDWNDEPLATDEPG